MDPVDAASAPLPSGHPLLEGVSTTSAANEAMLRRLFDASPDSLVMTEIPSGRLLMCNDAFLRLTGFSREEVTGRTTLELGVWHAPQDREELLRQLELHGVVRDHAATLQARDGRLSSVIVSASRLQAQGRTCMVVQVRDITDSERERLINRAILENASIGIAYTRDRRFQSVNPCFEAMFGWPPGELAGQPGAVVWPGEEAYCRFGAHAGPLLSRFEPVDGEFWMRRRDGSVFPARVCAKAIDPSHPARGGTIWIVEDVTERKRFEDDLAAAKEQAEAANRAKSAFLANTSHEIRTPLNGVLGLARLALAPDTPPQRQREYLRHIVEAAENLSAIISDILDLSKIEAGKFTVEPVAFDLGELLESLASTWRPLASAKGLSLWLEPGQGAATSRVLGDAVRLKQILNNYLSNALKFTSAGHITLEAQLRVGPRWRFMVRDTGIGMDEATRARVFEPFYQADASTTRRFGGTGLGLAICRELAGLMTAEVGVDSRPGEGSTFWLDIDLPAAAPDAPVASSPAGGDVPLSGARVLLVEDNPVNVMVAQAMLESWGIDVRVAHDGRQAVEAVAAAQPRFDAVLMDVQMPSMDGHEATQALRQHHGPDELPIIALTADVLTSERERSLALGMNDFVSKPIDAERLREALVRWIRPQADAVDRPRSQSSAE